MAYRDYNYSLYRLVVKTRTLVLGVLAPNAMLRSQIVPGEGAQEPNIADADGDHSPASTQARLSWAQ